MPIKNLLLSIENVFSQPQAFMPKYRDFYSNIQFGRNVDFVGDIFSVLFPLPNALGKEVFDLPIHGTEVVLRPSGDGVV